MDCGSWNRPADPLLVLQVVRVLFAISLLALLGLLWACLSAARHVRRARRRTRSILPTGTLKALTVDPSANTALADLKFEEFEDIDPLSEVTAAFRGAPPLPRTLDSADSRNGSRRDEPPEPFPFHQAQLGSRPSPSTHRTCPRGATFLHTVNYANDDDHFLTRPDLFRSFHPDRTRFCGDSGGCGSGSHCVSFAVHTCPVHFAAARRFRCRAHARTAGRGVGYGGLSPRGRMRIAGVQPDRYWRTIAVTWSNRGILALLSIGGRACRSRNHHEAEASQSVSFSSAGL